MAYATADLPVVTELRRMGGEVEYAPFQRDVIAAIDRVPMLVGGAEGTLGAERVAVLEWTWGARARSSRPGVARMAIPVAGSGARVGGGVMAT